ncbi:hypothetical protein [Achromobacter xylosoxidans]|uniref:hypothetical protein n=1 Tax=Alcaligenes xylosoxydans xylosoxydans TaxID=85698 RepID=UPI000B48F666|nr:hypothetical protein [Achromobacter xylosoxidans]
MIDLDRFEFAVECPRCSFATTIFYRDARLRDVLICRGCKANIQLDDHMNECRKARRQFNSAMQELEATFAKLKNITIRL